MGSYKDNRPVTRELAGGESQGEQVKKHFYKLPEKRIPNYSGRQLDRYWYCRALFSILIESDPPLTFRTNAAALLSVEFNTAWREFEAATDEKMRDGFFQIASNLANALSQHRGAVRCGRRIVI